MPSSETSSWHPIKVVYKLDTPKEVTQKRGHRYCIVSSVAGDLGQKRMVIVL